MRLKTYRDKLLYIVNNQKKYNKYMNNSRKNRYNLLVLIRFLLNNIRF